MAYWSPRELIESPCDSVENMERDNAKDEEQTPFGDKEVQAVAISNIDNCNSLPKTTWWRLEGVTYLDCALITDLAAIFIEGKRTERDLSKEVLWYKQRNQVHRNLDCAAAYAQKEGLRHYFVITIIDRDLMKQNPIRQKEWNTLMSPEVIYNNFPHLNDGELKEITRHYVGVTTWEDIIDRFGLRNKILPHPINQSFF